MTRAVEHKPCPRCKVSAVRAGIFGDKAPVCPRCGYPGAERRTQVERVQDLNAVSMAHELDRVEKLEAELEKAKAEIAELKLLVEDLEHDRTAQLARGAVPSEPGRVEPPGESTGRHDFADARTLVAKDGEGYYRRPIDLSTGKRQVLAVKVAPWAIEWLKDEGAWAQGARGGASGMAARILESAAASGGAREAEARPDPAATDHAKLSYALRQTLPLRDNRTVSRLGNTQIQTVAESR